MQPEEAFFSQVRFEDREGYLYAFMTGNRKGLQDAVKYWQHVIEECGRRGAKKVLIEQYFAVPLSTFDAFYLIQEIARMSIPGLKAAFIDQDLGQNDVNMFGETVAVNRGLDGRVFTNTSDAIKWLLS